MTLFGIHFEAARETMGDNSKKVFILIYRLGGEYTLQITREGVCLLDAYGEVDWSLGVFV